MAAYFLKIKHLTRGDRKDNMISFGVAVTANICVLQQPYISISTWSILTIQISNFKSNYKFSLYLGGEALHKPTWIMFMLLFGNHSFNDVKLTSFLVQPKNILMFHYIKIGTNLFFWVVDFILHGKFCFRLFMLFGILYFLYFDCFL